MDQTTVRRLIVIVIALLSMTGQVTMLGISRWTGEGGSYRIVQPKEQSSQAKQKRDADQKSKKKDKKKRKSGRPKGSKNKNRRNVKLSSHLQHVQTLLKGTLKLLSAVGISITWFVFDGAFGNNYALQMVQQCGLHLISKLRYDAALYFPYTGTDKRCKYGNKLNYAQIPDQYIQSNTLEKGIRTIIYQMTMWHKLFPDPRNIVIIRKINVKTGKQAHVVLFSSNLDLDYNLVVKCYRLRFQIEEIITAGGMIRQGRFSRLNVGQTERALQSALDTGVSPRTQQQLIDIWPDSRPSLERALEVRAQNLTGQMERLLRERAEKERQDIEAILTELARAIESELAQPAYRQLELFTDNERSQLARNTQALQARLKQIPAEIEAEQAAIRARYADSEPRLFPVAVTFLLPERLA